MSKDRNDYFRSQLSKPLGELQLLEDKQELELSFSYGICLLMKKNGGAHLLLTAVAKYQIQRETDPFCDNSGGMLEYCNQTIFFKITTQQQTVSIDFGLYTEINAMRRERHNYQWYALMAVT